MKSEAIFNCTYRKEALRLKEILAQRLRQTIGMHTIDIARSCLTVRYDRSENKDRQDLGWFAVALAENRPVEKLDLERSAMYEFLRGVLKGEQLAKKAAKDAALLALTPKGKLNKLLAGKKKRK